MDLTQILTFASVTALLVVSPGPNGLLIAKTVPISGRAAGFANIAGFIAAFFVHGTLSILGISAILMASATAFAFIKLLGAAYLIWIGVKALIGAWRGGKLPREVQAAVFRQHVAAARETGLPLVIHTREADDVMASRPSGRRPHGRPRATLAAVRRELRERGVAPGDTVCAGSPPSGSSAPHQQYAVNGMADQAAAFTVSKLAVPA